MQHLLGAILIFVLMVVALMTGVSAWMWWMNAGRRTLRALTRVLGAPPEVFAIAAPRSQGIGMQIGAQRLAVVRGVGDRGLVYDLHEMIGVELIFDGQVAARMFKRETRKPLDQVSPQVERVALRLVFDDVRDPEFEIELLNPGDFSLRDAPDPHARIDEGRRWFARLEAVLRHTGSD